MSERAPERGSDRSERQKIAPELKSEAVVQAEHTEGRTPEKQAERVERARERLKQATEKQPITERTDVNRPEAKAQSSGSQRMQDRAAYRTAMQRMRQQLTPAQRQFSRLVHARPVEAVSELLEETVYRPSFLIGGGLGALIVGTAFYLIARHQGFPLSGSEFSFSLLIGGVIGWLIERLAGRRKLR